MAEQNLKLNVTANVSAAQSALKKLKTTLDEVKNSAKTQGGGGLADGIKSAATEATKAADALKKGMVTFNKFGGTRLQERINSQLGIGRYGNVPMKASDSLLADQLREEERAAKEAASAVSVWNRFSNIAAQSTSGFGSSLSHLFRQFKRIATYRFFKSILKGITDSFRIGTQNLVQYSAALNGLDAAAANPTMSQYATQLLYVRNSVAAAAMPALQALIPVISTVANWFVAAANAVNQFISVLQGKSTFTKAKEYAVDYAGAVDGIGSAAGRAAKQMQQLMDFDEINNIISPKDSGGGGGGGANPAQDFTEMFEEAAIGEKFQKIADFVKDIKEAFSDIWDEVKLIGAALLAWRVSDALLRSTSGILKALGAMLRVAAGITLVITGVKLSFEAGMSFSENGLTLEGVIKAALGAAASGIGGYLLAPLLGVSGGMGFAIGITLSLVGIISGFMFKQGEKVGKGDDSLKEQLKGILGGLLSGAVGAAAFSILGIGTGGVGFVVGIGVAVVMNLIGYIKAQKDAGKSFTDWAEETIQKVKDKFKNMPERIGEALGEAWASFGKWFASCKKWVEDNIPIILTKIVIWFLTLPMKISNAIGEFPSQIKAWKESAEAWIREELPKVMAKFVAAFIEGLLFFQNIKTWVQENITKPFISGFLNGFAMKSKEDPSPTMKSTGKSVMSGFLEGLVGKWADVLSWWRDRKLPDPPAATATIKTEGYSDTMSKINALGEKLKNIFGKTYTLHTSSSGNVHGGISSTFASGGFPTQGSLFLAGETAGQTEWLGNVNGKTGVVSGNEITGIADAIYAASERETQTLGNLLMQIAKKELTITPSASLGRVNAQSAQMYGRVTGA